MLRSRGQRLRRHPAPQPSAAQRACPRPPPILLPARAVPTRRRASRVAGRGGACQRRRGPKAAAVASHPVADLVPHSGSQAGVWPRAARYRALGMLRHAGNEPHSCPEAPDRGAGGHDERAGGLHGLQWRGAQAMRRLWCLPHARLVQRLPELWPNVRYLCLGLPVVEARRHAVEVLLPAGMVVA